MLNCLYHPHQWSEFAWTDLKKWIKISQKRWISSLKMMICSISAVNIYQYTDLTRGYWHRYKWWWQKQKSPLVAIRGLYFNVMSLELLDCSSYTSKMNEGLLLGSIHHLSEAYLAQCWSPASSGAMHLSIWESCRKKVSKIKRDFATELMQFNPEALKKSSFK